MRSDQLLIKASSNPEFSEYKGSVQVLVLGFFMFLSAVSQGSPWYWTLEVDWEA